MGQQTITYTCKHQEVIKISGSKNIWTTSNKLCPHCHPVKEETTEYEGLMSLLARLASNCYKTYKEEQHFVVNTSTTKQVLAFDSLFNLADFKARLMKMFPNMSFSSSVILSESTSDELVTEAVRKAKAKLRVNFSKSGEDHYFNAALVAPPTKLDQRPVINFSTKITRNQYKNLVDKATTSRKLNLIVV